LRHQLKSRGDRDGHERSDDAEQRAADQNGDDRDEGRYLHDPADDQRVTSASPEGAYEAQEKYGRDLVAEGRAGKLDPVIGRDAEIRRVIQILSRKTKNNPVLIGDPGVGKTAIVEGLAPLPRNQALDRSAEGSN